MPVRLRTTPRTWAPSTRVSRAIARLSRDRWIDGEDAYQMALRLAAHCSGNPTKTADAAVCMTMRFVGVLRGLPPLVPCEPEYVELLLAIKSGRMKKNPELTLLSIMEKNR